MSTRFFRPFQQKIDPAFHIRVLVTLEMQFRNVVHGQPGGQFMAQEAGGMVERRRTVC
jgi:hypothetical protein